MGTPDFAASCLRALVASGENIVGCVTGADRARGRGMKLTPTPVKSAALEAGIPVFQPATLRGEDFAELLISLSPDLIIVAAYGKLLPENVLSFPRFGCVNAHASLLPKYRGAAPIQRAILAGEREIGVTAMKMEAGLDTGDMILTEKFDIADTDDFGTVHAKLAEAGGDGESVRDASPDGRASRREAGRRAFHLRREDHGGGHEARLHTRRAR